MSRFEPWTVDSAHFVSTLNTLALLLPIMLWDFTTTFLN